MLPCRGKLITRQIPKLYTENAVLLETTSGMFLLRNKILRAIFVHEDSALFNMIVLLNQYMPPMSGLPIGAAAGGVGISVTMLSVVSSVAATEAAF